MRYCTSKRLTGTLHSVYTPGELRPDASLPVVVWIHGGGCAVVFYSARRWRASYSFGRYIEGGAVTFSGQDLIEESDHGVVVVIIQYRLGVFGFLPGSQVRANGTLNAGLRKHALSDAGFVSTDATPTKLTRTMPCNGCRSTYVVLAHVYQSHSC